MTAYALVDLFNRLGDTDRMHHLAGYDLFDPALPARLDAIAAETARQLNAPVSLISVILDSSQFILGSHGVGGLLAQVQGTPAEWALCTHTVLTAGPYCVTDGTTHPTHLDNPLLALTGLRSYAGVPLTDGSGHTLGAHCAIDAIPRTFTDADIAVLTRQASQVMEILAEYHTAPTG